MKLADDTSIDIEIAWDPMHQNKIDVFVADFVDSVLQEIRSAPWSLTSIFLPDKARQCYPSNWPNIIGTGRCIN